MLTKKIVLQLIGSLLLFSSLTSTSASKYSVITRAIPHCLSAAQAFNIIRSHFKHNEKIFTTHFTEITDPTILSFLKKESQKVTPKNIRFFYGDTTQLFFLPTPMLSYKNHIFISMDNYAILEKLLINPNINNAPEMDRAKTLNIQQFLVQHEAAHIHHNDYKTGMLGIMSSALLKIAAFEVMRPILNTTAKKALAFLGLEIINGMISTLLNHSQEKRADEAAHGHEALMGAKTLFENIIALSKVDPQQAKIEVLDTLLHPSNKKRLARIEERIRQYA